MTLMDRGISTARLSASGQSFEVRWSSLSEDQTSVGVARRDFVLQLQIINHDHALVEAWIESAADRKQVLDRQPMRIVLDGDERSIHVDVIDEHPGAGVRIMALSMTRDTRSNRSVLYAQTTLLRKAGFAAGTHDRPRVLQHAANMADAATA